MREVSYNEFMEIMVRNSKLEIVVEKEKKADVENYFDDNFIKVVGKVVHFHNGDVVYNVLEGLK